MLWISIIIQWRISFRIHKTILPSISKMQYLEEDTEMFSLPVDKAQALGSYWKGAVRSSVHINKWRDAVSVINAQTKGTAMQCPQNVQYQNWIDNLAHLQFMMKSSNGYIFRITGPSFTGDQSITRIKASDAELWCFLWSAPESTVEQIIVRLVIWDDINICKKCQPHSMVQGIW